MTVITIAAVSDEARYEEALRRARLGYAWMKEHGPTHEIDISRIDLDVLNMRDECSCALSQASGRSYAAILESLLRGDAVSEERVSSAHFMGTVWGVEHGFNTILGDWDMSAAYVVNGIVVTYDDLDRAWRQILEEDRQESAEKHV